MAGLSGDSGKTLVALGLIRSLARKSFHVAPFKKGPDYIDAAWLGRAASSEGRNLDAFMMSADSILASLSRSRRGADFAVIEGNRGLYDGMDLAGSHSTAELAKLTKTPVFLVVPTDKSTRTVAALVRGCQVLDPDAPLAGVILNRVATKRQEDLIRRAVELESGLPVVGAIPRLKGEALPSRHLGLVTSIESSDAEEMVDFVADHVGCHVDLALLISLAEKESGDLGELSATLDEEAELESPAGSVRLGVLKDRAFSFYYPENLEALRAEGAELEFLSPVEDDSVGELDGLYAGGGFPEVYAEQLSLNEPFRNALKRQIEKGIPVWAECGGLMYLAESMKIDSRTYPMVGVLPVATEQTPHPQGHGYVEAQVVSRNPFLEKGREIRGHEFHYSRLSQGEVPTALLLNRGVGVGAGRDGLQVGSIIGSYTHIHALGEREWASSFVCAALSGGPL